MLVSFWANFVDDGLYSIFFMQTIETKVVLVILSASFEYLWVFGKRSKSFTLSMILYIIF